MTVPSAEFSRIETVGIPAASFGAAISVGDQSPAQSSFLSMAALGLWGYVKLLANLPNQLFGRSPSQNTQSGGIGLNALEVALTTTVGYGAAKVLHGEPSSTEIASTVCAVNGLYLFAKTLTNPFPQAVSPAAGSNMRTRSNLSQ